MSASPLTPAEQSDTRRFCGYPVSGAVTVQVLGTQGNSATLDTILASLTDDQLATLRTIFLANLYTLELALIGASSLLYVDKAAVFTRNANEIADRENLFQSLRLKLCYFLGIGPSSGIFAVGTGMSLAPAVFVV